MCVRAHLYDSTEPAGVANIFQADWAVVYPLSVMWVGWIAPYFRVGTLQTCLVLRYAGLQNSKNERKLKYKWKGNNNFSLLDFHCQIYLYRIIVFMYNCTSCWLFSSFFHLMLYLVPKTNPCHSDPHLITFNWNTMSSKGLSIKVSLHKCQCS